MLTNFTPKHVYIVCGYTDLRLGIDGLAALVEQEFELNLFDNTLFLFCGRRADRIKALYWNDPGLVLLYTRLENGNRFQWPRTSKEAMEITQQQYRWLMEGLKIEQPRANKSVNTENLCFS